MNKHIIIASLKARPVRTTVSILAVALEVALILLVVGLISGASTETAKRIEGVGADIIIQPPNASFIFALNSASLKTAYAKAFADVEGWTRASILTVARMGRFSSDRAIREYCSDIWQVEPILE